MTSTISYSWEPPIIPIDENVLNPKDINYPVESRFSKPNNNISESKKISSILKKYPNLQYKNQSGYNKLIKTIENVQFMKYAQNSKFFDNVPNESNKTEDKEHANVKKIKTINPDLYFSVENEKTLNKQLDNPNSNALHGRVMEDNGIGTFRYDVNQPNFVKNVQEANQSFAYRRDRFFIAPQPTEHATDESIANLLKEARKNQAKVKKIKSI